MDSLVLSEANGPGAEEDNPLSNKTEERSPGEAENKFQKAIAAWRGMLDHPISGRLD